MQDKLLSLLLKNKILFANIVLFFTTVTEFCAQELIVKNEDSWHYYDLGYLSDDWLNITDFSEWKNGKSPLGYGDRKNNTNTLYYGENKQQKHIVKYFKKKIFIKDNYLAYEFKVQRDDGAVVYVNGKELFRDNMPNASITNTTLALSTVKDEEEHNFTQHFFDNKILNKGENILSVAVYQAYERSSDCIFSLELLGHKNPEVLTIVLDNKNKTNSDLEAKIKNLNSKFEFEKILLQKDNLQSTNTNLKLLTILLSIFLVASIFGYYLVIENHKKRITKIDKEINNLKSENLEKDKKIMVLSSHLLHNKQHFKEIKADLNSLEANNQKNLKSIINQIDTILQRDEDWEILKKHFNAVYEGFYENLLRKHPQLSETELRHCMFIKLHLQTKEIARILLIDPRSVQTARYRIKKKMNLAEDEDLRDYLINLS